MTDPADIADSRDSTENADPMLNADAKDPTDPTDRAEPTDPMDRTEPRDPMDKTESCDHKDHFDDGLIGPFSMPTVQAGGARLGSHRPPATCSNSEPPQHHLVVAARVTLAPGRTPAPRLAQAGAGGASIKLRCWPAAVPQPVSHAEPRAAA